MFGCESLKREVDEHSVGNRFPLEIWRSLTADHQTNTIDSERNCAKTPCNNLIGSRTAWRTGSRCELSSEEERG